MKENQGRFPWKEAAEIIERHNDAIGDYRMRIEALEAEVKRLRYPVTGMMLSKPTPSMEMDNIRFVVPIPQSVIGVLEPQDNPKAKAEPAPAIDADETNSMLRHKLTFIESDAQPEPAPTEPESDNIVSWVRVEGLINAMSESINTKLHYLLARITGDLSFVMPKDAADVNKAEPDPTAQIAQLQAENEELRKIKQFPWTIEYKSTPIDPTAQKIEALKLLFPWRDGCEFMTVNWCDGSVCQWSIAPENVKNNYWTAWGKDPIDERVGEITPDDLELSKILISRHEQ